MRIVKELWLKENIFLYYCCMRSHINSLIVVAFLSQKKFNKKKLFQLVAWMRNFNSRMRAWELSDAVTVGDVLESVLLHTFASTQRLLHRITLNYFSCHHSLNRSGILIEELSWKPFCWLIWWRKIKKVIFLTFKIEREEKKLCEKRKVLWVGKAQRTFHPCMFGIFQPIFQPREREKVVDIFSLEGRKKV